MEIEDRAALIARLRCAEGHVRGIIRMIEADADRPEVLHQLRAVGGALQAAERELVRSALDRYLSILADSASEEERRSSLNAMIELQDVLLNKQSSRRIAR